jgi:hypothetical protein
MTDVITKEELESWKKCEQDATVYISKRIVQERQLESELATLRKERRKMERLRAQMRKGLKYVMSGQVQIIDHQEQKTG